MTPIEVTCPDCGAVRSVMRSTSKHHRDGEGRLWGRCRSCGHRNQNAGKTHCKRGHPFDAENTYIDPRGRRVCIVCNRDFYRRDRVCPSCGERRRLSYPPHARLCPSCTLIATRSPVLLRDRRWLEHQYVENGSSGTDIGKLLGCSNSTVMLWLRRHGIEVRTRGEAVALAAGTRGEAVALAAGTRGERRYFGANRQMVTGRGGDDRLPGTVKHFGRAA